MVDKVFSYRDTMIYLSIGLVIFFVAMLNTLFLNFVFISLWGVHVGFGNRLKKISNQFDEADRISKEINNGNK